MSWTLLVFDHKPALWLEERLQVYLKRLQYWVDIEHKVFSPSGLAQVPQAKQNDWDKFITHKTLPQKTLVVFDERGANHNSHQWAKHIALWQQERSVCFVIGPSYGLSPQWQQHAHASLSLSPLTLTHEFAQLLVVEQLFRAFTILKGLPYHIG